jgi:hypothetical protein
MIGKTSCNQDVRPRDPEKWDTHYDFSRVLMLVRQLNFMRYVVRLPHYPHTFILNRWPCEESIRLLLVKWQRFYHRSLSRNANDRNNVLLSGRVCGTINWIRIMIFRGCWFDWDIWTLWGTLYVCLIIHFHCEPVTMWGKHSAPPCKVTTFLQKKPLKRCILHSIGGWF